MWEGEILNMCGSEMIFVLFKIVLMHLSTDTFRMIMDPGEVPVRDGGGTQGRLHHRLKGESLNFLRLSV